MEPLQEYTKAKKSIKLDGPQLSKLKNYRIEILILVYVSLKRFIVDHRSENLLSNTMHYQKPTKSRIINYVAIKSELEQKGFYSRTSFSVLRDRNWLSPAAGTAGGGLHCQALIHAGNHFSSRIYTRNCKYIEILY